MMSSENILNTTTTRQATAAVSSKELERNQNNNPAAAGNHRKTAATRQQQKLRDHQQQQQQALNCPRCDSPNTKFCYYNNYSLTQPRHFCKTCRRYWTKGGALRNVPIGGGCKKNKKFKSSTSSRLSESSKDSGSSSSHEIGGFKFFHGLSPAMDFQLAGLSFPRLNINNINPSPFSSLFGSSVDAAATNPASCFSQLDHPSSGFNYHQLPCVAATNNTYGAAIQETASGSLNVKHNGLASSIESLSSINQDLHWRLQQQRLALFPDPKMTSSKDHQETSLLSAVGNSRNDAAANGGGGTAIATEWFFGNSYDAPPQVTAACTATTTISYNDITTIDNWNANGVQPWSDLHRYSTLP